MLLHCWLAEVLNEDITDITGKLIPVALFKYRLNSQYDRDKGILISADALRERRMAAAGP
jgi:hypothetical protein